MMLNISHLSWLWGELKYIGHQRKEILLDWMTLAEPLVYSINKTELYYSRNYNKFYAFIVLKKLKLDPDATVDVHVITTE